MVLDGETRFLFGEGPAGILSSLEEVTLLSLETNRFLDYPSGSKYEIATLKMKAALSSETLVSTDNASSHNTLLFILLYKLFLFSADYKCTVIFLNI
jgi:hypothetical protein